MAVDIAEPVYLRSGQQVLVRTLRSDDRARLVAMIAQLSDESRYRRFHGFLAELPEPLLDQLLDVDHHDREALVAVAPGDREIDGEIDGEFVGEFVGVARFARDVDRPETADLAVVVVDDWHRRGLAALLLRRLAQRAHAAGVRRFTAEILATNGPTLDLVRRLGPAELTPAGTTVTARMDLADWPSADAELPTLPITRAVHAWLGLSAEVARTLLIPVTTFLPPDTGADDRDAHRNPQGGWRAGCGRRIASRGSNAPKANAGAEAAS